MRAVIVADHVHCETNCGGRLDAGILLGLELLELFGDLGPGAAGELVPPPGLPVRAVASTNRAVPAALGLVLVNRSFDAPAPGPEARLECQTRA